MTASNRVDGETFMVGRAEEISQIVDLLVREREAQIQIVLVSGEPGIGKTTVLDAVVSRTAGESATLLRAACFEDTARVAYAPVAALAEALTIADPATLQDLGSIDPEGFLRYIIPGAERRSSTKDGRTHGDLDVGAVVNDRLGRVFASAATRRPLILVLDDLHWIDDGSARALRQLIRHLRPAPVTILGAFRDTELGLDHPLEGVLRELARERLGARIHLRRLGVDSTQELVAHLLGDASTSVSRTAVEVIHRESEGVPFFVEELTQYLREESQFRRTPSGEWRLSDGGSLFLPPSVRSVVGHRISRLSAGAQDTLSVASVVGRVFEFDLLSAAIHDRGGKPPEAITLHLDEGLSAGLIAYRQAPGSPPAIVLEFSHEQIRDVMYHRLGPIRRRGIHQSIALVLERSGSSGAAEFARLARHFSEGADIARGGWYSIEAARAFGRIHASDEAIAQYRSALDILEIIGSPITGPAGQVVSRFDVLLELEAVCAESSDRREQLAVASKLLEAAEALNEPAKTFEALHRASNAAVRVGDSSDARRHSQRAWELLEGSSVGDRLVALIDLVQAQTGRRIGEPSRLNAPLPNLRKARELLLQALAESRGREAVDGVAAVVQELGVVEWELAAGDHEARSVARTHLLDAHQKFRETGSRRGEITALIALAYRRRINPDADAAHVDESFVAFLEEIRRLRASQHYLERESERTRMEALTLLSIHVFCRANGWYEVALERGSDAAGLARRLQDRRLGVLCLIGLAETECLIGRPLEALRRLDAASALLQAGGTAAWAETHRDSVLRLQAAAFGLAGQRELAVGTARRRLESAQLMDRTTQVADAEVELAEIIHALEVNDGEADQLARRAIERTALMEGSITWDIRAELVLARIELKRGNTDMALRHALAASARMDVREIPHVWLQIETALVRGLSFEAGGMKSDAIVAISESMQLVEKVAGRMQDPSLRDAFHTANTSVVATREAARRLGIAATAAQETTVRPAPGGLTRREVEVLKLVAAGLSNREIADALFISEKTVARHLTNLFTKIDAQSRTQAAGWAFRHELV